MRDDNGAKELALYLDRARCQACLNRSDLIVTCRLHQINPYDYLVDVLQRVSEHPASRVAELTPRQWKPLFAANPVRSRLTTMVG